MNYDSDVKSIFDVFSCVFTPFYYFFLSFGNLYFVTLYLFLLKHSYLQMYKRIENNTSSHQGINSVKRLTGISQQFIFRTALDQEKNRLFHMHVLYCTCIMGTLLGGPNQSCFFHYVSVIIKHDPLCMQAPSNLFPHGNATCVGKFIFCEENPSSFKSR